MGALPDLAVRPATLDDVPEMSRVFVDTFRTAHRDHVPEHLLLERTYETSARGWTRALKEIADTDDPEEHVAVAVDGSGRVVGLGMVGPPKPWDADDPMRRRRPTGECYALYVDVSRQRSGAGVRLLAALAAFMASRGVQRLLVGVLAVNAPGRAFYEAVGGVAVGERTFDDSGVLLDEVVYGWDDLTDLVEQGGPPRASPE
jgi:ribosomal protein S18 acetylase RimI-like enzyme